ncbi:MAG: fibronectin type III domain-containing protein [Akkermansiaceae bacterium]|nr:fibronectin type III domain-containing protein [Akkermansiaceae bacterium]
MNRPYTPPANGPGAWAVRVCLASLLAGAAAAQTFELRQTSVPVGIVNQTSSVTLGTQAATVTAPETSGSYTFCYWTLNATRRADPGGTAQNPATFTVVGAVDAVAIYVPTNDDTDTDGLPDWWEFRQLGNLASGAGDNPDGDAYINSDELARGLPPNVHNLPDHGGVSRRRWITSVIQDPSHYVRLTELSSPVGVIQQTRIVPKGAPVALANPPTPTNGWYFTGWLLGGARYDLPSAWQPISVTPDADMTLVARYVKETDDTDGDGLLDWKEWLWFEGLQYTNASDPDLDGFSVAEEETRGFTSPANDELAHGGLSRRRAASIFVDTTGRLAFRQASDPATILDQTDYYPGGSLVTVPSKEGHSSSGYQFTWWDLNGVRQADASGAALPGFSFTLNTPSTATAHYIDPNIDTDGDSLKDWFEWTYFGTLVHGPGSDPDGDGFDITTEVARNQAPQVYDDLVHGGLSRRRSAPLFASTVGHLALRTTSAPVSILNDLQYHLPGTLVTVADKTGHTYANYQFSWWDRNGVRQEDPSGVALGGLQFPIEKPTDLVGNYIDPTIDTDADGIKDWHEWTYYGTLDHGPDSDTDADGHTYADEQARGQSPRVTDELVHGGISRRRGALFTVDPVVIAGPPEIGELQATDITATSATLNARINALSSATTANFEYGTTPAFGQSVASVSIVNGFIAELMTAPLTGLVPDTLYYFRVIATNSSGTTTSATATFRTTGLRTGYAEWAAIYSITDPNGDEENDGVPNLVEYAFGMHPLLADLWKLPAIEFINGRFRLTVTAPVGVNDVIYGAEYSTGLNGGWTALPDTGSGSFHEFLTPLNQVGQPKLFVRWVIRLSGP